MISPIQSQTSPENGGQSTTSPPAPGIVANRQQIDDRFPVLGFTISPFQASYFEVLLTVDRGLFDPARSGERTADNFYTSRIDSGLLRAEGSTVFIVPAAITQRFASSLPRPTSIFYTLITYSTADGDGPRFAHEPLDLPGNAPSVAVAGGFQGKSAASVLGISLNKLRRVGQGNETYERSEQPLFAANSRPENIETPPPFDLPSPGAHSPHPGSQGLSQPAGMSNSWISNSSLSRRELASQFLSAPLDTAPLHQSLDAGHTLHPQNWGPSSAPVRDVGLSPQAFDYDDGFDAEPSASGASSQEFNSPRNEAFGFPQKIIPPAALPGADVPSALEDEGLLYDDGFGEDADMNWDDDIPPYETLTEDSTAEGPQVSPEAPDHGSSNNGLPSSPSKSDESVELDIETRRNILERVAEHREDGYSAVDFTDEDGLVFGFARFSQASGDLGQILTLMQKRDPQAFADIFASGAAALLDVTNAETPELRLEPVAGLSLADERVQSAFKMAGSQVLFQAAQNQLASTLLIDPLLRFAYWLDLLDVAGFSLLIDRAIELGVTQARHWIITVLDHVSDPTERQQAMTSAGHANLAALQNAHELPVEAEWTPLAHAALVHDLRRLGKQAPVSVPDGQQLATAIVQRALTEGRPGAERLNVLLGTDSQAGGQS